MPVNALLAAYPPMSSGPQTASDDFNSYANGSTLSGQGHWLRLNTSWDLGVVKPSGDGHVVGATGNTTNILYYNSGTWSANQWSAITTFGTSRENLVAVRCASGGCYYARWGTSFGGFVRLGVVISGTDTDFAFNAATVAAGDVIRIEVTGAGSSTRLTLKLNGTAKVSNFDPGGTYLSSGNPGIGSSGNAGFAGDGITFWQASDI